MESQRLKVGKLSGNFKESYRKQVLQHPCLKLLEDKKYWEGMKEDVHKYVSERKVCQQNKSKLTYPTILLQPFPIPEQKWDSISMDFITGLPKYLGKDCIYVVVDRLKKFLISLFLHHILVLHKSLIFFSKKYSDYMGSPRAL